MRKLAVLGSPIAHSQSPVIHAAAYRVLGLPWEYSRHELQAADLAQYLADADESWLGFSCTMPLKEAAFALAGELDEVAQLTGVVNTLVRGRTGWVGANTDVEGLKLALEHHRIPLEHTVVLGAGATAVSAVLAARRGGAERITVLARRPEAAQAVAARFSVETGDLAAPGQESAAATCVISTLPGEAGAKLHLPDSFGHSALFDVAYDPWPSPLSSVWRGWGAPAYSGLDMLIYQAVLQIRLFLTGDLNTQIADENAVIDAMRQAVRTSVEE